MGSEGTVVVIGADGTAALVEAPADFPPATGGLAGAAWVVAGGTATLVSAAGVLTWTRCRPGVAEPVAAGLLDGLGSAPRTVVPRSGPGARSGSTSARVSGTRLRVRVPDAAPVSTSAEAAEAPLDSVVEALVPASAAPALTHDVKTATVTIRPKN
jgi:hypothetical protein